MKTNATKINKLFFFPLVLLMFIGGCGKYGEFGPPGEPGVKGDQGLPGADGTTILNGEGVPSASLGNVGDFYIDVKSANFYGPKSASGWDKSINLGTKGETGASGKDGADGKDGNNGQDGADGKDGVNGSDGADGNNGVDGKDGTNGTDGKNGSQIFSGVGIPAASLGKMNDYFIDFPNLTVFGPKVSDSDWGTGTSARTADLNGVKTVILKGMKFPNEVVEQRAGNSVVTSLRSTVIPTIDYREYYEEGMVMAFFKDPSMPNAAWTGEHVFYKEDLSFGAIVKTSKILFGKENVVVQMTELNADIPYAKENYMVDVKFVLIPGKQVAAMKAQNLNLNNAKEIVKFLKL